MSRGQTPIWIVDAFTTQPGAGNRAGVVLEELGLEEAEMQAIAKAVGASETAFVQGCEAGGVALRYFTPTTEVPFCGHATVATLHALVESGRFQKPGVFHLHCAAGTLAVEVADDGAVWLETPRAQFEPSPLDAERLMRLLGGQMQGLDPQWPILKTGYKLMVPVVSRAVLEALSPRWADLMAYGQAYGVTGFYVWTRDAREAGNLSQGRYFAPAWGISEDPVTGSASGPFAEYLERLGCLSLPETGGTVRAVVEQGDAMGKPGRVSLELTGRPGAVERVRIGGRAVTVMTGALQGQEVAYVG